MTEFQVDPIIEVLANKKFLASRTRSIFRWRRPDVEKIQGFHSPFTIDKAAYDAMRSRSLCPEYSGSLLSEVARLALVDLPNHEQIRQRRQQKADTFNGLPVDQQR